MYVQASGPANAPAIVFLHGGGISGWMWEPQVEALRDHFHCLVPDLPEHGRSAGTGPLTLADSATRVAEVIRQRAVGGRAHLVGLSLGAQLAAHLLAVAPELVDHAVLSGTLTRSFPGMNWLYPSVNWMYRLYTPFKDTAWLIRANMQSGEIPAQFFEQVRADTQQLTPEALTHVLTENMNFRPAPELNGVQTPVLVVAGEKEYGLMHDSVRDLLKVLPNAKGVLAPGLGHTWNLQAPDLFNRTVRAWLTGQPLPKELLPVS